MTRGGAPQLDERSLDAAMHAALSRAAVYFKREPMPSSAILEAAQAAIRAYLAASPGAGELDLTAGEIEAVLRNLPTEPGFHLGFGGNFNAAVAKLRARLDRKDDDGE